MHSRHKVKSAWFYVYQLAKTCSFFFPLFFENMRFDREHVLIYTLDLLPSEIRLFFKNLFSEFKPKKKQKINTKSTWKMIYTRNHVILKRIKPLLGAKKTPKMPLRHCLKPHFFEFDSKCKPVEEKSIGTRFGRLKPNPRKNLKWVLLSVFCFGACFPNPKT